MTYLLDDKQDGLAINPMDAYCGFGHYEFDSMEPSVQIDWQIRELFDKLDEVITAVNDLVAAGKELK